MTINHYFAALVCAVLSFGISSCALGQLPGADAASTSPDSAETSTPPPPKHSTAGTSKSDQKAGDVAVQRGKLILVTGAAGTPEYSADFLSNADRWLGLAKNLGLDAVEIGRTVKEGVADRELLSQEIGKAVEQPTEMASDVWLVLIGHGTSERGATKFNLQGPDVTPRELADWLRPISSRVIIVNCSSSSSPFLPELSGANRVIITATRSGSENNYSRFGNYLAAAISDGSADLDHDDEVSLLEAFLAASGETERFYREQTRLATEHSILDDNADKLGTGAEFFQGTRPVKAPPAGKTLDGDVARQIIVYSSPDAPKFSAEQLQKRQAIEKGLAELRVRKASLGAKEYWNETERLLLELSDIYEEAGR